MSTESTPQPSPLDNAKAVLAPMTDRFVSEAARDQLASLMAAQFGNADPAIMAGAIQSTVGQPAYQHFFRPQGPALGSLEAIGAQLQEQQRATGGMPNSTPEGGRVNFNSTWPAATNPGTPAGRSAANTEMEELSKFAGRPGVHWNQLSSAEQLYALSQRHRASMASQSGLVLVNQK